MAEPQTHPEGDKSAGRAQAPTGKESEARSFGQGATGQGTTGQGPTGQTDPTKGAQRYAPEAYALTESGRRAGRHVADAWGRTLDPFLAMQMDMNRWFDDLWRQATGLGAHTPMRTARPLGAFAPAALLGQPAADLRETDKAYELAVELPGLGRDDIEVTIDPEGLTISGHKAERSGDGAGAYRFSERRFGRFERTFPLPDDIDRATIEAAFKDGLLSITLPKTEDAAASRSKIEIR